MSIQRKTAIGVFATLLLLATQVFADDNDFFEQGFATSPLEDSEVPVARPKPTRVITPLPKVTAQSEDRDGFFEGEESNEETKEEISLGDDSGLKVKAVKFIVHGNDILKAKSELDSLVSDAIAKKVPVASISILGSPLAPLAISEILLREDWSGEKLYAYRNIEAIQKLPDAYAKTKSWPLVVLQTDEGEILLEGTSNLGRFLTKGNNFIEPQL